MQSVEIFIGGDEMIATTTSDIIYVSIALIMMFVSGYILGTIDEMGRENRRKEKLRRKRERKDKKQ